MVDDSAENIRQAQSRGLKTLLYPQPWNESRLSVEAALDELTKMAVSS
jgi:FMN phosphatase YigB (HAD superfamily)